MKKYWNSLKEHAGVQPAAMLTLLAVGAGACNKSLTVIHGALFGLAMSSVFWLIVLTTNYTNNKK